MCEQNRFPFSLGAYTPAEKPNNNTLKDKHCDECNVGNNCGNLMQQQQHNNNRADPQLGNEGTPGENDRGRDWTRRELTTWSIPGTGWKGQGPVATKDFGFLGPVASEGEVRQELAPRRWAGVMESGRPDVPSGRPAAVSPCALHLPSTPLCLGDFSLRNPNGHI